MTCKLACILAAGLGTRLGERGELGPKGFLRVGEAAIIEESLAKLYENGVERVVIVTGHHFEHYEVLAIEHSPRVQLVHNPHFAESGSLYSLCCAKNVLDETFLLLESDLIYESRALEICQADEREDLILVSGFTQAGDEVYVETKGQHLLGMSKNKELLGPNIVGEFVGICKVSEALLDRLVIYAEQCFHTDLRIDYETDGLVYCASQHPIACRVVPDLAWAEIDTLEHLERARNVVYPRLAGQ